MFRLWHDMHMDAFHNSHPNEEELERYVMNRQENREHIEEHLLFCHTCLDAIETIQFEVVWIKQALICETRQHAIATVA
jgi:hypothetical protein